ncbi:MAG TPA: hypothetical protein VGO62_06010, partial [Myxococcota bacterium]
TPVVPGQGIRARISFSNAGDQVAQAVVLNAPLQQLRLVADSATDGGVISPTQVHWDASQDPALARMNHGDSITVEFTGHIASPLPDNIDIPVEGQVTSATTTSAVIIGPKLLHTRSRADLSATTKEVIDDDGGLVEPGDTLTYRITVLNGGGNLATDVHVFDAIPGGTVYVPGSTQLRGAPIPDLGGAGAPKPPTESGLAIGDLDAGLSALVQMKVRVTPSAPRGVRIDNQAILRATGVPDSVSDNPATPLVVGDPTPVVVGGGASLIAQLVGAPSPVTRGQQLHYEIRVENVGTDPAGAITVDDAVPTGCRYVPHSLVVDGAPATDVSDRDDAEIDGARITLHRQTLEAGDGLTLGFAVVVLRGPVIVNQATVESSEGTLLTDGDETVAGEQPTQTPVKDERSLIIDPDTTTLSDDDGGLLQAGDGVTVRASVRNHSQEHALVSNAVVDVSALLDVDPLTDARFVFDAAHHSVLQRPGTTIDVEDGGALDIAFHAKVSATARVGDHIFANGRARATTTDHQLHTTADLGKAELTVGLLPGTAAIEGSLFLDGGAHDGVFQAASDVKVRGVQVLAFSGDDKTPVQTAISDATGHYKLLPIPSGAVHLLFRSSGGAAFGLDSVGDPLTPGEVRKHDVALVTTGAVYFSGSFQPAAGARVFLFNDDGNANPADDVQVPDSALGEGQQGQEVTEQGLYRFDPPPGRYRIQVETPDPLTAFPSSSVPIAKDANPFGPLAQSPGDVVQLAAPDATTTTYVLRFTQTSNGPALQRDFIPVDALKSELVVTKTANQKIASVGDIVSYTVRLENHALSGVSKGEGGVEIVDALPPGFQLVKGSYLLDRVDRDARGQETRSKVPVRDAGGALHTFGPFEMLAATTYELRYNTIVGPGTTPGEHNNRAEVRLAAGQVPLSAQTSATVTVVPDATFDLGTIRTKVFCDDNGDGWQDPGELGLPGVRLVIDTGQWIDSDLDGKAHFSAIPAGEHMVKIDDHTLPPGTTLPSVRSIFYMSPGLPVDVSFGAKCAFVKNDKPEVVIDEDVYRPAELTPKKVHIEGQATPP